MEMSEIPIEFQGIQFGHFNFSTDGNLDEMIRSTATKRCVEIYTSWVGLHAFSNANVLKEEVVGSKNLMGTSGYKPKHCPRKEPGSFCGPDDLGNLQMNPNDWN